MWPFRRIGLRPGNRPRFTPVQAPARPHNPGVPLDESIWVFRYPVLRDTAYQLHVPTERAWLHGQALLALEQSLGDHPAKVELEGLVVHAVQAGDGPREVRYRLLAGAAAARVFDNAAGVAHFEAAAAHAAATPAQRLQALREAADLLWRTGKPRQAEVHVRRALALPPGELPDAARIALTCTLGNVLTQTGRYAEAEAVYASALTLAATMQESELARVLGYWAVLARTTGDLRAARARFEQALEIQTRLGQATLAAVTTNNLAGLYRDEGDLPGARDMIQRALDLYRQIGSRRGEGLALSNLGLLADDAGDHATALRHFELAIAIHREVGNRRDEGVALSNIAGTTALLGRPEQAMQYYENALALHREVGNRRQEGRDLSALADLCAAAGRKAQARTLYLRSQALFSELKSADLAVEVADKLARL